MEWSRYEPARENKKRCHLPKQRKMVKERQQTQKKSDTRPTTSQVARKVMIMNKFRECPSKARESRHTVLRCCCLGRFGDFLWQSKFAFYNLLLCSPESNDFIKLSSILLSPSRSSENFYDDLVSLFARSYALNVLLYHHRCQNDRKAGDASLRRIVRSMQETEEATPTAFNVSNQCSNLTWMLEQLFRERKLLVEEGGEDVRNNEK